MGDRQKTLADEGFERYRKPTRREQFLEEMDRIAPEIQNTPPLTYQNTELAGSTGDQQHIDQESSPVYDDTIAFSMNRSDVP